MTYVVIPIKRYVSGHYTLTKGKVDSDGVPIPGTARVVADFDNLITDDGIDMVYSCTNNLLCMYCAVGTGSTPPAVTDTQLDVFLAGIGLSTSLPSDSFVEGTPAYWRAVYLFRFTAGTATGNLTEVGTGDGQTDLFSRALILDGGGSPTTITVLADEYLDVTYELRNYIDKTEYPATITISSVPYDIAYKPASISTPPELYRALISSSGTKQIQLRETDVLGTVYQSPSGAASVINGIYASYTSGNSYADITFTMGLSDSNFATGIGSAEFLTTQCKFQMSFNPKIPKTSSQILTLTFRVTWARYP